MKGIWTSRKFWAMLAAVGGAIAGAIAGEISWGIAIGIIVAAIDAYIIGTGIEAAGEAKVATRGR